MAMWPQAGSRSAFPWLWIGLTPAGAAPKPFGVLFCMPTDPGGCWSTRGHTACTLKDVVQSSQGLDRKNQWAKLQASPKFFQPELLSIFYIGVWWGKVETCWYGGNLESKQTFYSRPGLAFTGM